MTHLVVLAALPYYELVTDRIRRVSPSSSLIETDDMHIMEVISKVHSKPFYSDYYWIIVHCTRTIKALKVLAPLLHYEHIRLCLLCPNRDIYMSVIELMDKNRFGYNLLNTYRTHYMTKVKFIMQIYNKVKGEKDPELSFELAKYIASRVQGYERQLEYIFTLVLYDGKPLTKTTFSRLLPEHSYIGYSNYMLMALNHDNDGGVRNFVAARHSYIDGLLSGFREFFRVWELLFEQFAEGILNEDTESIWLAENGPAFKITTEYQVNKWLYILNNYSYELMEYIWMIFEAETAKSKLNGYIVIIKLISSICEEG